jgi:Fe-S-cluster-containing dehydrogenase component
MSTEQKQGFLTKEVTRRQFMKISGKSIAGLTLSAGMLQLLGCTQEQVDDGQVALWSTPQGLLVVNADICVGCLLCETNCTLVNDGAVSSFSARIKVTRNMMYNQNGVGLYADLDSGFNYHPDTCRQCEPAPCRDTCPINAIYVDNRGVKLVCEESCLGCGICRIACPWDMIVVNPETNKAVKCVCCDECVDGCPSGALSLVTWDAVTAAAQLPWRG